MSRRKIKKKRSGPRGKQRRPERVEIRLGELRAIIDRAQKTPLSSADRDTLMAAVETLGFITQELEAKGVTIARLRKLLFGPSSEKTKDIFPELDDTSDTEDDGSGPASESEPADGGDDEASDQEGDNEAESPEDKRKGHGRNAASEYSGADKVLVQHESLAHRDRCPKCQRGKIYQQAEPAVLVRVRGVAPLSATVYELERLRCNLCGEVFTANAPKGVGDAKYDATAAAMIALLKYGCGLPFNRLEKLGANLKIPLPAATQWDVVSAAAAAFEPVWAELVHQAAAGEVVYIDDTKARVLSLNDEIRKEIEAGQVDRTGVFTSGVVSTIGDRKAVLFFTSRRHAGENLAKVLAARSVELPAPIQMSDALSRNTTPGDFETIVANCLVHARRNFVDVKSSFPDEVKHVVETLRAVYKHEATTRDEEMSPDDRLRYHQEHSEPLMSELAKWLQAQFDERRVEPNSSLGGAISYMKSHWDKLTRFLTTPGAPLDNNICERVIKKAILFRKSSLFYKTENGAHVGDVFMSLIHTAELCEANPFEYLVAIQKHADAAGLQPDQWMPWNYTEALAELKVGNPSAH